MIEKNVQEAKIRKGPPSKDPTCLRLQETITIPAGTILRSIGDDEYSAAIGFGAVRGNGIHGAFTITLKPGDPVPPSIAKVIAA